MMNNDILLKVSFFGIVKSESDMMASIKIASDEWENINYVDHVQSMHLFLDVIIVPNLLEQFKIA